MSSNRKQHPCALARPIQTRVFLVALLLQVIPLMGMDRVPQALPAQNVSTAAVIDDEDRVSSDRDVVELVDDSNLAEAIERRPDLDFRNVTIDGEKVTVSLADIPADQVISAEVSKSVTPDLDADLRGGGLNLRSRPTYDLQGPVLKGFLGMDHNTIVGENEYESGLTYGRPMGDWGFISTLTVESGRDGSERYRQDWEQWEGPLGNREVLKEQVLDYSGYEFAQYSLNGTVDFRLSDPVRLFFKGNFRHLDRTGFRPRLIVRESAGTHTDANPAGGSVEGARLERYFTSWDNEFQTYSLTMGAYLDFRDISIDYQVTYNNRDYLEPDWLVIKFDLEDVNIDYDLSRNRGPVFQLPEGPAINDPTGYVNDWVSREYWERETQDWTATANAKLPLRLALIDGHWKTGFKFRGLDQSQLSDEQIFDNFEGVFTLADVLGPYRNTDLLGGLYDHGPFPSTKNANEFLEPNRDRFQLNQTRSRESSDPSTYSTRQEIYAGYSQLFLKLKGLRIIAGIRYEQTDLNYLANELILDEQGQYLQTNALTDSNSYTNWFPGIHGRYDMGALSFVGSWSNTIERPYFGQVVPFRNVNREEAFIESGNPALKPTLFNNYDFSIDYEMNKGSSASVELFYQTVEDIAYFEVSLVEEGAYKGYEFGTVRNGPSGDIYGFRIIYAKELDDWVSFASGLSFSAKYVYQVSETVYPGRPDSTLPMPGRPENALEVSLTYQRSRLFAQLEVDYRESHLDRINENKPWKDRYDAARTRVDFASSYKLTDGVRLLFEVDNLTNAILGESHIAKEELLSGYAYRPRSYKIGLKFDL